LFGNFAESLEKRSGVVEQRWNGTWRGAGQHTVKTSSFIVPNCFEDEDLEVHSRERGDLEASALEVSLRWSRSFSISGATACGDFGMLEQAAFVHA
jgi:hypothetical protein